MSFGETAGSATVGKTSHALLWNGAVNTVIDLDPGLYGSFLNGVSGITQYGANAWSVYTYWIGKGANRHLASTPIYHAAVWHSTSKSVVDLNPYTATTSFVAGGYANRQVGAAVFGVNGSFDGPEYAYMWSGTAASGVDINNGYAGSQANCMGTKNIGGIGWAYSGANGHAILWPGPSFSTIVDLHPAGYTNYYSTLTCLDDARNQQGGYLFVYNPLTGLYDDTAFLWKGTPNGISLAPAGSSTSAVLAMGDGYQAGWATIGGIQHAVVWHGSAASAVDLGPGVAQGVDGDGDIVGLSAGVPVIWRLMSAPHISVTQTPEPNEIGWCNHAATFSITSPFTSGTPTISTQWDALTPVSSLGSSFSTTSMSDGTHYLTVLASNGTQTTYRNVLTVNVDTTPPATVEALAGGAFTLTASDAGSGVQTTYYSLDGAAPTIYTGPVPVSNIEATHSITLPVEPPSITTTNPTYAYAGAAATTITISGADFGPTSVVLWNGTPLVTQYVSASQLTAVIPAADLVDVSTDSITVNTPGPNGGTSNAVTFTVLDSGN
jgi:hypothetical protein